MIGARAPGRMGVAVAVVGLAVALVLVDAMARPIDPFAAPAPSALGSGAAPAGGHCSQAP